MTCDAGYVLSPNNFAAPTAVSECYFDQLSGEEAAWTNLDITCERELHCVWTDEGGRGDGVHVRVCVCVRVCACACVCVSVCVQPTVDRCDG